MTGRIGSGCSCFSSACWARFRFSVVGSLLSAPLRRGQLQASLQTLADKTWTHPVSGELVHFAASTIERWFYTARRAKDDPLRVLQRAVRKDCGKISLPATQAEYLFAQYRDHEHWSYQLHYDNLVARVGAEPVLGPLRSYSTVRRYMQAHGWVRKRRAAAKGRPGEILAAQRRERREIRSYEAEYVGSLWHLDFHHGSLPVLTSGGQWQRPLVLGILDDHARLCCHLQWYLSEMAEDLVHGLSQGIQKRGLPRSLMSDGGAAMIAEEVREGLLRLGIVHEKTLPYSPYQNGKQERFWATLEGRLMEMLAGVKDLTLEFLNEATQAWAEMEYNRAVHRELGCSPVERWARAPDVLRPSPSSNALREAFRLQTRRRQRQSDGTISLEGVRFEIPRRYRHFRDVSLRYARWDLRRVDLVDPRQGTILSPIYPLDRRANADGQRLLFELDAPDVPADDRPAAAPAPGHQQRREPELPPLLKRILAEYSATGMPLAYLPKKAAANQGEAS
ncbi:MAG: DDE-type integrase/transposase/recombinase [Thioalkalivibrio sp.]|nr:DDE-type integrase/transposase/recombinase [Thioalkalivibrio sp.]